MRGQTWGDAGRPGSGCTTSAAMQCPRPALRKQGMRYSKAAFLTKGTRKEQQRLSLPAGRDPPLPPPPIPAQLNV